MKKNSRKNDIKLISKAYEFAKNKHKDQLRKSGEPYIIHPIEVAFILADLGLDDATVCAALLHDVLEDTDTSKSDLEKEFNNEVAEMVDGVTKLSKLKYVTKRAFRFILPATLCHENMSFRGSLPILNYCRTSESTRSSSRIRASSATPSTSWSLTLRSRTPSGLYSARRWWWIPLIGRGG